MIIHILPAIGIEASGPCYSVPRLCESLIDLGVPTKLAVLDWVPGIRVPQYVERFPLGFGPRRLGRSPAMSRWLVNQAISGQVDVIHNHGLWMMPNVYPGWARKKGKCRLIVSPRGTISEWALKHHGIRKKIFWRIFQGQTMHRADCFHATAESEFLDLRRLGFKQPVCILPNGIDTPPMERPPRGPNRRLLYLGRIHKIKGIDILLRAWRAVQARFGDWELMVAGPDDGGYLAGFRTLAEKLGAERVSFPGPFYGEGKLSTYRQASIYVLPTHSDNFAMTVAEALAAGTPAIATRGAPWSGLERERAGWWIEIGVDPLVACLEKALALSGEELEEMGRAGHQWMLRDYSWETIARQMSEVYRWLCGQVEKPKCIMND